MLESSVDPKLNADDVTILLLKRVPAHASGSVFTSPPRM